MIARVVNLAIAGWLLLAQEPVVPDPAALMKEVQEHQRTMDQVRENYTFHRIRRVEDLDGKGTVKNTSVRESEVFFVNGRQIARLIRARRGSDERTGR